MYFVNQEKFFEKERAAGFLYRIRQLFLFRNGYIHVHKVVIFIFAKKIRPISLFY